MIPKQYEEQEKHKNSIFCETKRYLKPKPDYEARSWMEEMYMVYRQTGQRAQGEWEEVLKGNEWGIQVINSLYSFFHQEAESISSSPEPGLVLQLVLMNKM